MRLQSVRMLEKKLLKQSTHLKEKFMFAIWETPKQEFQNTF